MKTIMLYGERDFKIIDQEIPKIKDDEVLLQIKVSGVCVNDIRDWVGQSKCTYPLVGGHEYCGIIREIGEKVNKEQFRVGDRAAAYVITNDDTCELCRTGHENICQAFFHSPIYENEGGIAGFGGFGEYIAVKADKLFVFNPDVSFEKIAFTEPLSCVVNSIDRTDIELGDDVVIIGAGTMGLLHLLTAKLKGARVIVSEPIEERRKKALELGAAAVIDPVNNDAVEEVKRITGGLGAKVVFNTTAIPALMSQAIDMLAAEGTAVAFSSMHPNTPIELNCGRLHSDEIKITGAANSTVHAFFKAYELINKGILDPTVLTEKIFDYTDYYEAMEWATRPETYKVLISFGDID